MHRQTQHQSVVHTQPCLLLTVPVFINVQEALIVTNSDVTVHCLLTCLFTTPAVTMETAFCLGCISCLNILILLSYPNSVTAVKVNSDKFNDKSLCPNDMK